MLGRALHLSLDCSTIPLICTLYCWVLSKEVSSTIFWVFGMTRPGIEHRSPGPLKSAFLTASTPRCKGWCYSFPWIAPLYPWSVPYNAEASSTIFWVFGMTWLGIEPRQRLLTEGVDPGLSGHWQTLNWAIGLMSRVFTNHPGDWGSIPGWVVPKTRKWYMMPPC